MKDRQKQAKKGWKNDLAAWKTNLSPERLEKDEKRLKEIFALATKSPALAEALEWANSHGVQFIIDRQCIKGINAYYQGGTGVVAIAERGKEESVRRRNNDELKKVESITHEIRHAWQDYNGLLSTIRQDFRESYIKIALVEADAMAYGRLAAYQLEANRLAVEAKEPDNMLWKSFMAWFETSRTHLYGDAVSKGAGAALGIAGVSDDDSHCEYTEWWPTSSGIDISHQQDIKKLGQKFKDGNYFPPESTDIIQKKILPPSLAMTFYNSANDDQKKLVTEIRKRELKQKLGHGVTVNSFFKRQRP